MPEPLNRTKYIAPKRAEHALMNYTSAIERLRNDAAIFRGLRTFKKLYGVVKPSTVERKSKNTKNVYTALIDILPSWKDYPKRSRNIVCSSDQKYAEGYTGSSWDPEGALYCVLPKNGAKIGICPDDDIWNSFPQITKRWQADHMDHFNRLFEQVFYTLFKHGKGFHGIKSRVDIEDMTGEQLKQLLIDSETEISPDEHLAALEELEEDGEEYELEQIVKDIRDNKIEREYSWFDYFDELLSPHKNGFALQTIENYNPEEVKSVDGWHDYHEVWTDADSLFIRMSHFNKASERVGNDFEFVDALVKKVTGKPVFGSQW